MSSVKLVEYLLCVDFGFYLGVFTILLRKLGLQRLEVTELYSIEPWATAHLERDIRALIFCYPCSADVRNDSVAGSVNFDEELADPDAEEVWFAHQLSVDACASQTILNICLNMAEVSMSMQLCNFYNDTLKMDPLVSRMVSIADILSQLNPDERPRIHKLLLHSGSTQFYGSVCLLRLLDAYSR